MKPKFEISSEIDEDIAPLVIAMNVKELIPYGSCSGHSKTLAYVGFQVKPKYIPTLCKILNKIGKKFWCGVWFDLFFIWDTEISGSYSEHIPGWYGFELHMRGLEDPIVPPKLLKDIAKAWKLYADNA